MLAKPSIQQVRVEQLHTLLQRLAAELAKRGTEKVPAPQLPATDWQAKCLQCGLIVSGEELAKLAQNDAPTIKENPRLSRLNEGYCARNRCEAYYYELTLPAMEGIDWTHTWPALQSNDPHPLSEADDEKKSHLMAYYQKLLATHGPQKMAMAGGCVLVFLLMVLWQFRTPSWSKPTDQFQVSTGQVFQVTPPMAVPPQPQPFQPAPPLSQPFQPASPFQPGQPQQPGGPARPWQ